MKWKVLQTIQDRDTGEVISPGGIWDDRDQRTEYERDILMAMNVIEPLQESRTKDEELQHEQN